MKSAKDIIEELNNIDEHQQIEAKLGSGHSTLETICAFANESGLDGGIILIGVEREENTLFPFYDVKGVEDTDKITCDIASQCASMFNIPIRPTIKTEEIDGKKVILIEVAEAANSEKPIYFKKTGLPKGAYRRIGSTDQKCTEDDLVALFSKRDIETYDETILQGASPDDIDPEAVEYYRVLRKRVNPTAEELSWSDEELLVALSALSSKTKQPTLTGILLFGTRKALRRLLPMTRVDYIRIPGKEWVEDPDERFSTTDMRGSLLQLVQRVQDQVFEDLPKGFSLGEGSVQAESQSLPAKVLREAIVNALMHASYRMHQPIQILRYNNRIEIKNSGYSLKNEDQLGEPGSRPRNPKIAAIFHETNLAETKGSGIRIMRKLMEENGFAPPTFESDRESDLFTARLLLHHFLTNSDISWLAGFGVDELNDAQKRSLIFVRETGAVDNQTYRQINAADTLGASTDLRHLRDIDLLEKRGKGSATYYVPGKKMLSENGDKSRHQLHKSGHQLDESRHQLEVPAEFIEEIESLGKSPRKDKTKSIILKLCKWKELSAEDICSILGRKEKKRLVRSILKPMIEDRLIEQTIPESPNHPYQKYKTIKTVVADNG